MPASPQTPTALERTLGNPELVSAVFQELAKGDLCNFLTMNRYFFGLAIKHLWSVVPDVRHVLALIGGPRLVDLIAEWHERNPCITFPSQVRRSQLARFNVYNRHVRILEVFSNPDNPILWVNLGTIGLPPAQPGPSDAGGSDATDTDPIVQMDLPLLPKLRILEVTRRSAGGAKSTSHELYQWIRLFCSETCATIRLVGARSLRGCWMNGPDTTDTFHILTQRYANLECLELFSKPSRFSRNDVVTLDPALLGRMANFLRHSPRLTTLSLGCDVISPCVFAELAGMPNLKTLRFCYHRGASPVVNNMSVPEWSFPQLARLELHDIQPESLLDLLSAHHLFQNLHTLAVSLDIVALPDEPDETMKPIFQEIVKVAPRLRDLAFVFPQSISPSMGLLPSTVEVLAELGLVRLHLECVRIRGTEGFTQFHDNWPALLEISWQGHSATADDLAIFAPHGAIEVLAVSSTSEQFAPQLGPNVAPINPGALQLPSDLPLHDFDSDDSEVMQGI